MVKITEALFEGYPDRVTQGGQTAKEWLELNGWTHVGGENEDAVFKCPITKDNYTVGECLRRQSERPIEDQVVLLIRDLQAKVDAGDNGQNGELVTQIGALQSESDKLKIQNSDLNGRLQLALDARVEISAQLDIVTKERDSARELELAAASSCAAAKAALDAANAELTSLKATPPAPQG